MKLLYDFNGYESLYVCGDIHGEFKTLTYEIKRKGITDAVILVAGDCGIGFEKPAYYEQLYRRLEKTLRAVNCMLLLVRGNHDDPEYFRKELIDFPLMKTVPDYSVIKFAGKNILCVGGGVSVDRSERLAAMLYATQKREGVLPPDFNLVQCLFGEHLLSKYPERVVSLVESEKSALIGACVFPGYVWLATGGKSQLSVDKVKVLHGRTVIMFPDVDAYDLWRDKAAEMRAMGINVAVSDLLEKSATQADRDARIDIADWLRLQLKLNQIEDIYKKYDISVDEGPSFDPKYSINEKKLTANIKNLYRNGRKRRFDENQLDTIDKSNL